ncbi:MAG: hypothetical protein VX346_22550 [Planctomycetota bacterium]|nr:hypothetical protein [Planctomycetota bacterium]
MTSNIDSWSSPTDLGPLYPLAGYEFVMFIACAAALLGFLAWKFRSEHTHYRQMVAELTDPAQFTPASSNSPPTGSPSHQESQDAQS